MIAAIERRHLPDVKKAGRHSGNASV
jgi:hypothetical protein